MLKYRTIFMSLVLIVGLSSVLAINVSAIDDIFEENDVYTSAKELTAGTYTGLTLADDDWYKMIIPNPSQVDIYVTFSAIPTGAYSLYEDHLVELAQGQWEDPYVSIHTNVGGALEPLYLKFYKGTEQAAMTYTVTINIVQTGTNTYSSTSSTSTTDTTSTTITSTTSTSSSPYADQYEENDLASSARQIGTGIHSDLSVNDDDWYKIVIEQPSSLDISVEFTGTQYEIQYYLYDNQLNQLAYGQWEDNKLVIHTNVGGSRDGLYLKIMKGSTSQSSIEYSLAIIVTQTGTITYPSEGSSNTDQNSTTSPFDLSMPGYPIIPFGMITGISIALIILIKNRKRTL